MNALVPSGISEAMQLANMMSTGKLVPKHLQGKAGDCLMVIEQAMRWGMSPFAVAQCTSIIHERLMFEGKLVAAAVNTSGILNGRLNYTFSGEGAKRKVTAIGVMRGETEPRTVDVDLAAAKTTNEHWNKSPDQMLTYHAARVWARRHAPEVMLGVYSPEEFDDAPKPADTFKGTTIEGERATPSNGSLRDAINASVPLEPKADKTAIWMGTLRAACDAATTEEEVAAIGGRKSVSDMLAAATPPVRQEINDILADAYDRVRVAADDGSSASEDPLDALLDKERFPG